MRIYRDLSLNLRLQNLQHIWSCIRDFEIKIRIADQSKGSRLVCKTKCKAVTNCVTKKDDRQYRLTDSASKKMAFSVTSLSKTQHNARNNCSLHSFSTQLREKEMALVGVQCQGC